MLLGNAAEPPQHILQALGQRDESFAAEHNMGMLETRECQSEVIEPMCQRDAGNRDAEHALVGEVGQATTAGLVLLPEEDVLVWAGQRPPTVARFERGDELKERTIDALQRALEVAGVEFTNGDQPGVRLTKAATAHPLKPASVSKPTVAAKAVRRKTAKAAEKKR